MLSLRREDNYLLTRLSLIDTCPRANSGHPQLTDQQVYKVAYRMHPIVEYSRPVLGDERRCVLESHDRTDIRSIHLT